METLEGSHGDVCHEGVELIGRIFVVVPSSAQADAYAERYVPVMERQKKLKQIIVDYFVSFLATYSTIMPMRHLPDSLGPKLFVETSVDSDIGCSHLFLRKLSYFLDRARRTLLETNAVKTFVKIHGVLASHNFIDGTLALLFVRLCHYDLRGRNNTIFYEKSLIALSQMSFFFYFILLG